MSKSKNNYRSVHRIITEIELKGAYTEGSSTTKISDDETRNGIHFINRKAYDVYAKEGLLERLKQDPAVRNIGAVQEVRYRNLDTHKKEL